MQSVEESAVKLDNETERPVLRPQRPPPPPPSPSEPVASTKSHRVSAEGRTELEFESLVTWF